MTEFEEILKAYYEQDDPDYPTAEEVKLKWFFNAVIEAAAVKVKTELLVLRRHKLPENNLENIANAILEMKG